MPTTDQPEFPDGCFLCDRAAGLLHHVSYEPEIVVLLCSECHGKVHSMGYDGTPRHPELHPDGSRKQWEQENWGGNKAPTQATQWATLGSANATSHCMAGASILTSQMGSWTDPEFY